MVCDCGSPALQDGKHIAVLNYGVKGFLPWCICGRLIDRLEVLNFTVCDIMSYLSPMAIVYMEVLDHRLVGSLDGGPEL